MERIIPKAFIKQRIMDFIHEKEEVLDRRLDIQELINELPAIYTHIMSIPECKLDGLTLDEFMFHAQGGLNLANMRQHFQHSSFGV